MCRVTRLDRRIHDVKEKMGIGLVIRKVLKRFGYVKRMSLMHPSRKKVRVGCGG